VRDRQFITIQRGGLLTQLDHKSLMRWALICTEHTIAQLSYVCTAVQAEALHIAYAWIDDTASVYEAMQASRAVHAEAKMEQDIEKQLVIRCIGHAVATAHMADHCLGPAWYGRKLIRLVGGSLEQEYQWQLKELEALPTHLHQLVKTSPKFQLKPSDITK
jgi:hypothetical protein